MSSGLYQKEFSPHQRSEDRTKVWVSFEIYSVRMINEIEMTFTVAFLISLDW